MVVLCSAYDKQRQQLLAEHPSLFRSKQLTTSRRPLMSSTLPSPISPASAPPQRQFTAPHQHQFTAPHQHQFTVSPQHQFTAPPQHQYTAPPQHQFPAPFPRHFTPSIPTGRKSSKALPCTLLHHPSHSHRLKTFKPTFSRTAL